MSFGDRGTKIVPRLLFFEKKYAILTVQTNIRVYLRLTAPAFAEGIG